MKTLFILGLLSVSANAAVTIGGAILTQVKGPDGATAIPAGTLGMLIVDTAGDGFFSTNITNTGNSVLLSTQDPKLTTVSMNTTAGQLFGGERILSTFASVGTTGTFSNILTSVSIAGLENKNFAIVWVPGVLNASKPAQLPELTTSWGFIRGADWTLPTSDAGTFTSSATDASGATSFFAPNATTGGALSTAFRTVGTTPDAGGAGFGAVIPEPSAALLGALGALGLLRRRRI